MILFLKFHNTKFYGVSLIVYVMKLSLSIIMLILWGFIF
jgi:hypothetical protein